MPVLLIGFRKYPSAFALTAAAFLALLAALFAGTDTAQAQLPPNNPPAGTPIISGTARVGELLTVDTASITDVDGLTNATFSYDWLADDGPSTIGDLARLTTTENVYRIRPDDVGLAIKVQVSFTDDAGNVEALSSATTATVVASEPAPPENFSALPDEPGELDLEWDAPSFDPATGGLRTSTIGDGGSPITSYTVQWREGTSSGCSNTSDVSEVVVSSGTMHTIPGLDHTSRYCLRVIATNAVGDSAPSAQLWRGPAPPHNKPATGAPTVTGTLRVGEFVTADTTGIADEDGLTNGTFAYGWVLKPTPDPFSVLRLNYKKRRFLVPPDAAGRTIQVLASIRDDLGHFESLRGAPTAVVAPTFPDPPRNLVVLPSIPGVLAVQWEAPVWSVGAWLWDGSTDVGDGGSPITSYTVQWREGTSSGCSNTSDVSEVVVSSGTMHTIPGLDHTSRYCLRVIATNAVGDSAPSAQLWRGPAPPHNKPATGAPTVTGTLRVGEFVTADTTGIADEDGLTNGTFAYGWVLKPTPDPFSVLRLNYKKRRFLVPPDAAGRTIQVLASIRDDLGHFESLRGAPTAVVAPTFPDPPRNLAVAVGGPGALAVEWEPPVWNVGAWLWDGSTDVGDGGSPITSYTVQWREDTGSWTNPADVSEAVVSTGTTYTISGLDDTLDYYVRVIATNDVGHGEPSAEATSGGQPAVVVGPTGSPVGGGGGGGGPSPSVIDFEWSVTRDIEELDSGHDKPSGTWSDGVTLWVLENGDGTDDAIYAYDVKTGERVEGREFALDGTNRAPRGVWSDGSTAWVSDSGRNRLFAHDLASGERVPERDIALADRNSDARGIWSGDETMWVLDGGTDSLFAYDLASGELLAEYALHDDNSDPHGIWSDGVTVWVSDHGAKRLFAYRLPAPDGPAAEDAEPQDIERVIDEEFEDLSQAGNNSPRGLWSDGDVMYVADESDARVYTYNMPNAIDARLASLSLSGVEFDEFDRNRTDYEGAADEGVTETTVTAEAVQRHVDVDIDPPDADEAAEGHQVALQDLGEITVTVTSADGSRKKTYRVRLGPEEAAGPAPEEPAGPVASCLRGDVAVGFSLVVYAGGSVEDLVACAEGRNVTALYVLDGGEYVSYILGAPEFVNRPFTELFPDGIPAVTPLVTGSNGPPSPYPGSDGTSDGDAPQSWPDCLRGEIATGFSLVVSEGRSVDDLVACASSLGITALYTLNDGVFVSYIIGAPEFVNRAFREQFPEGVPAITPLVAASDGPPAPVTATRE